MSNQSINMLRAVSDPVTNSHQVALGTLLIVDDQSTHLLFPKEILGAYYRIISATNGSQALQFASSVQDVPDLILLKDSLPDMSGCDLCQRLKSDAKTSEIPVIVMVTTGSEDGAVQAYDAGADEIAFCPIKPSVLLRRMATQNRLRKKNRDLVRALSVSLEKLSYARNILDNSLSAMIVIDLQGRIVEFNQSAETLFGFSAQEILGRDISDAIIPLNFRERHKLALKRLREQQGGTATKRNLRMPGLHAKGHEIDLEIALAPVVLDGRPHVIASIRDSTLTKQFADVLFETLSSAESLHKEKQMEIEKIREAEKRSTTSFRTQQLISSLLQLSLSSRPLTEQLRLALDLISKVSWLSTSDIGISLFLFDASSETFQLVARKESELSPLEFTCQGFQAEQCVCTEPNVFGQSVAVHNSAGRVNYCIKILLDNHFVGALIFVLPSMNIDLLEEFRFLLLTDTLGQALSNIISRVRMDESLREAKEKAEQASKAKSEFLSNMSHEIRSPLNSIIGLTDLIVNTSMTHEDIINNIQIVHASSFVLLDLINNILDLSKIESGHFSLECIPFDIIGQVEDVCELMAIKAHQKGVELYCRIATDIPLALNGDPTRLKQVLINLINNAIKFTPQGEIVVSVERGVPNDHTKSGHTFPLRFAVSDTGIGIPREKMDFIFGEFVQVDGSTARKYGGTGLGLTIAKHLVGMMGGRLLVDSEIGRGSTFYFTLDLENLVETTYRADSLVDLRRDKRDSRTKPFTGKSVLLADPHSTGQAVLLDLLQFFGCVVVTAQDTLSLRAALDTPTDQPFDFLVVDEDILQEDDARVVIGRAGIVKKTIIMMSHHVPVEKSFLVGIFSGARFVKKPVRQFRLINRIEDILMPVADYPTTNKPMEKRVPPTEALNILVVDDLPDNQRLFTIILGRKGHTVTVANNGVEALELLSTSRFDLILMDVQMPVMDGFETTRRIREGVPAEVGNPQIPIIAVTAMGMMNEREKCLDMGMNGYLLKPFTAEQLMKAMAPFARKKPPGKGVMLKPVDMDADSLRRLKMTCSHDCLDHMKKLMDGVNRSDGGLAIKEGTWIRTLAADMGATRVESLCIRLIGQVEMNAWDDALAIGMDLQHKVEELVHFLRNEEGDNHESAHCR